MFYSDLVNKAVNLSYSAHHGQKDKAGRPCFAHRNGESCDDYIRRIKASSVAKKVKLADIAHNMDEPRISGDEETRSEYEKRRKKYERAREILTEI